MHFICEYTLIFTKVPRNSMHILVIILSYEYTNEFLCSRNYTVLLEGVY